MDRPILKYHGGKWRIAKWIISNMPNHSAYVEPFCGAANVLLRKPRVKTEVLNDLNGRLVNLFRVLRDELLAAELKYRIFFTPCAAAEYLLAREKSDDPLEDARRMLILGHQGFGSSGPAGGKLSSWGRGIRSGCHTSYSMEWADILNHIDIWAKRLRAVFIDCLEYQEILEKWDSEETLFYADPPYVASTRQGAGNKGYAYEMTDQDHIELAQLLHKVKGKVVLSGYNSELYDDLYSKWTKIERAAIAERGKHTIECIWLSPNQQSEGMLF